MPFKITPQYLLTLFMVIILWSCSKPIEKQGDVPVITPEYDGTKGTLDMASKIELIPLYGEVESAETFISLVVFLVETDSGFFIMNVSRGNPEILKFRLDGQFQKIVGGRGKGPGEYFRVMSISDSPFGIHALDVVANNNILIYSDEGEFVKSIKFENLHYYEHILPVEDGYIGIRRPNYPLNTTIEKNNLIVVMDSLFNTEETFYPVQLDQNNELNAYQFSLSSVDPNKITYVQNLNDTIFSVTKEGVKPAYYIDYEDRKLPEEVRDGLRSESTSKEATKPYKDGDYLLTSNFYDNGSHYLINVYSPEEEKIIIYDKESKEQYHFNGNNQMKSDLGRPLGVSKDGAFFFAFDKNDQEPSDIKKELLARLPEIPSEYSMVLVKYYP